MDEKFLSKFLRKYNIPEGTTANSELIAELYDYDPSPNKKYLHWLYERFIEDFGLRNLKNFDHGFWDNVSKALFILEHYPQRFKNAELSTDIYSYKDLDSFIMASEKSFQRSNRKLVLKDDIDLVDEFDGIVILYPSTADASCYYGKGTRWCITRSSTYEDYMEKGNLFFILNKGSNGGDYKTALYIDALGKVEAFDSGDDKLTPSFSDVDKIEYDEFAGSIIYPKRVGSSIKKYSQDKINDKPKQLVAKVFANWVKSLGSGYKPDIEDIDDQIFNLYKAAPRGFKDIGQYMVADSEKLKELKENLDAFDIFNDNKIKTKNLIKVVGEERILRYFSWDDIFNDMLMDSNRYRFFDKYDIDNLTDEEIENSPELNDLKKEFIGDPVVFYDNNIYNGSVGTPPKYTNIKGLSGMLFTYDNYFDIDRFLKDYSVYCVDAKAEPITFIYNGKNYYILNKRSDNEDVYED
jgi:hypothetical protein